VNGRLVPATFDAVPRTPPDGLVSGFAGVFSAPSTPFALCVPVEAFDVLLVELELVFDVFDVAFELAVEVFDVFELVDDDVFEFVFELELVDVFELLLLVDVLDAELDDELHVSVVGTTCVDAVCPKTTLSGCFVKCAECVFVIRCSLWPCSTPMTDCDKVVTMSWPQTCVTDTCEVEGTCCVSVAHDVL
jgi:hypothetical protein